MLCLQLCEVQANTRERASIAADMFFQPSAFTDVTISPDGKTVAFLCSEEDRMCVATMDLKSQEIKALKGSGSQDVGTVVWSGDQNLVFDLYQHNKYAAGLYASRLGKRRIKVLNETEVVRIIDPLSEDPDHILAWVSVARHGWERLVKYNVRNGRPTHIARENDFDGNVFKWFTDAGGTLFGVAVYREQNLHYLFLGEDGQTWTPLNTPQGISGDVFRVLHAEPAARRLWLCAYRGTEDTASVFTYDMDSGELSEPIFRDAAYDIMDNLTLEVCPVKQQVVGLSYTTKHAVSVWFDSDYQMIQAVADASFPENINRIMNTDRELNRVVVYSYSDQNSGKYYVLDLKQRALLLRADRYRNLPHDVMAKQLTLRFKRPGGLELEGFVTLPGPKDAGPYPLVALPHGGPWARDTWGFDPEVQFLASRGYAVLQLNFRGSSGYPAEISKDYAGDFEGMVQDVIAVTESLVKSGVADRERLAILGTSFGGYAAALAPALKPDLYQCWIAIAGVFDLSRQIESWNRHYWRSRQGSWGYDRWVDALGDPETQADYLQSLSPQYRAADIKIPMMLIHGRSDRVAQTSQTKRFAKALDQAGNEPETHYFSWEGHGFAELKNRIQIYEAIELFLAKHLNPEQ